jgi:putative ABC transport system permease protein
VRGVPGVVWAAPLYKGESVLRAIDGNLTAASVIGVDDGTLIGVPRRMIIGDIEALRQPDAIIMDQVGYRLLWPGAPLQLGRSLEINDRRAVVVGIVDANPTFAFHPKLFTRYSQALRYTNNSRNQLSFILARSGGEDPQVLAARIAASVKLQAHSSNDFAHQTMLYYITHTAIPINFGMVIMLGIVVGATIVGLTFSMFIRDNLRQYAVLKAIGATDAQLVRMVMLQAAIVGLTGYGIGLALAAAFFGYLPRRALELRGFYLPWEIAAAVALATGLIVVVAGVIGLRRVLVLDPATVFRA